MRWGDIISSILGSWAGELYYRLKERNCVHTWTVYQVEECTKCGKIGYEGYEEKS